MNWNYRIIEHAEELALHEVYYDEHGRPELYTKNPVRFVCFPDEDNGIVGDLKLALRDVRTLPVLPATVFDLPIEDRPVCERLGPKERAA